MGLTKKSVVGMLAIGIVAAGMIVSRHAVAAPQAAGASGYHLIKKVKLGGTGSWDYLTVDQATHRVFISRATKVIVVDPTTEKILGEIPDTPGVHGIALAAEFNRGYTTNGRTSNSTIFDMTTLKKLGEAKTDKDPEMRKKAVFWLGQSHDPRVAQFLSDLINK